MVSCMAQQNRTRLLSHEADVGLVAVMQDDDSRIMVEQLSDSGVSLFARMDGNSLSDCNFEVNARSAKNAASAKTTYHGVH